MFANESVIHVVGENKRTYKLKSKKIFPTIKRNDLMEAIISFEIDKSDKSKLSNLYYNIVCKEKENLRYITEVSVTSKLDLEIYNLLRSLKDMDNSKKKKVETYLDIKGISAEKIYN